MKAHYSDDAVTLYAGDCLDVLRELPDNSVHSVVTDPPYGLEFMGKEWDGPKAWDTRKTGGFTTAGNGTSVAGAVGPTYRAGVPFQAWCEQWAAECLRVLTPGGHLLAFGGTRTWHRLACAIEDAGFEVRDSIAWLYGSGFPKSLDVSKAIDRKRDDSAAVLAVTTLMADHAEQNGITRAEVDTYMMTSDMGGWWLSRLRHRCACPTPEQYLRLKFLLSLPDDLDAEVMRLNGRKGTLGEAWQNAEVVGVQEGAMSGWNMDGTTRFVDREQKAPATDAAREWQGWGTALKPAHEPIVVARKPLSGTVAATVLEYGTGAINVDGCRVAHASDADLAVSLAKNPGRDDTVTSSTYGADRPQQSVNTAGRWPANVVLDDSQAAELDAQSGAVRSAGLYERGPVDSSGPAAINIDRDGYTTAQYGDTGGASRFFPTFRYEPKAPTTERPRDGETAHPTVKPLDLMRWLVKLVTPPGGTVLDPFAGSGTTAEACVIEGFQCITIEREPDYLPLIVARLTKPIQVGLDFGDSA